MVTITHLGRYQLLMSELGLQGGKLFGHQRGKPAKKDSGPARSPIVMIGDKTKTKQTKNSIVGPRSGPISFSLPVFSTSFADPRAVQTSRDRKMTYRRRLKLEISKMSQPKVYHHCQSRN